MTTKQQEFLDQLKNPTKARLSMAVEHFNDIYGSQLQSISISEDDYGQLSVDIKTGSVEILIATEANFIATVNRYMNEPFIHTHRYIEVEEGCTHRRTYFVSEKSAATIK